MGENDGQPNPPVTDWRPHLSTELQADPIVKGWAEKASEKDIAALIKTVAHGQHRLGSAINLPGKDAKPEELDALRGRLYDAGVFRRPPSKIEDYVFQKPDQLPDGLAWSDDLAKKFATAFLKHGIQPDAIADLLPLWVEGVGGASKRLKTDMATAMEALRGEYGDQFDARSEMVKRMSAGIFKTPEELQFFTETGLANHPLFLSVMMRLAPFAMQDSSYLSTLERKGGEIKGEDAKAELATIMTDPKHEMYAGYHRGDKKVMDYIDELYRKAHGTEPVQIA